MWVGNYFSESLFVDRAAVCFCLRAKAVARKFVLTGDFIIFRVF